MPCANCGHEDADYGGFHFCSNRFRGISSYYMTASEIERRRSYRQENPFVYVNGEPVRSHASFTGRHTVSEILEFDSRHRHGIRIACTCGWMVDQKYLDGLEFNDIRGMCEAHIAGGDVGPKQKGIEFFGGVAYAKIKWETPEISEPAIMPRRHFNLDLEDDGTA